MFYPLLRKLLFLLDAESAHHFTMESLRILCKIPFVKLILKNMFQPQDNPVRLLGLEFKNPIGLAAGFDKNAKYLKELSLLGFGFIETGTVTPLPQKGNPKPRLFRLPKDKALINRMGFNNDGVEVIAERIKQFREKNNNKIIIGGNIGKNKNTPNEDAFTDYEICFLKLAEVVDYIVVNVSSPNTPGLRDLQKKDELRKILTHVQELNQSHQFRKPILLKIAPDLNQHDLDDILDLAKEINLAGLIINNTTILRDNCLTDKSRIENIGAGGLSGQPLYERSNELVRYAAEKTNHQIPIIGSGGIMSAEDSLNKMRSGALLVQIFTGFIYKGPSIIKESVKVIIKSGND